MKVLMFLLLSFVTPIPVNASGLVEGSIRTLLLNTLKCPNCNLQNIDLSDENLANADLSGADLSGANLKGTNLRGANLQGARLLRVDLSSTALSGANLKFADLSDLDIDIAFEYVEIIGTQLEGAKFKDGIVCGPAPKKGGWGCQHL